MRTRAGRLAATAASRCVTAATLLALLLAAAVPQARAAAGAMHPSGRSVPAGLTRRARVLATGACGCCAARAYAACCAGHARRVDAFVT